MLRPEAMDETIVHGASLRVHQGGILCLIVLQQRRIVGGDPLHELQRLGSLNVDLPHVADVE